MSKVLFEIVCDYEVFDSELVEIEEILTRALETNMDGKFSNVKVALCFKQR